MAKVTILYDDGSWVTGEIDDLTVMTLFADQVTNGTDHYYHADGTEF
jgi:hypothetical protein